MATSSKSCRLWATQPEVNRTREVVGWRWPPKPGVFNSFLILTGTRIQDAQSNQFTRDAAAGPC